MSKRLAFLEKLTGEGSTDPLHWYGLALEYSSLGHPDDALATFEKLKGINARYVPMYLMCGQMLAKLNRNAEAKSWLEAGVVEARAQNNGHALGEIETALAGLED